MRLDSQVILKSLFNIQYNLDPICMDIECANRNLKSLIRYVKLEDLYCEVSRLKKLVFTQIRKIETLRRDSMLKQVYEKDQNLYDKHNQLSLLYSKLKVISNQIKSQFENINKDIIDIEKMESYLQDFHLNLLKVIKDL